MAQLCNVPLYYWFRRIWRSKSLSKTRRFFWTKLPHDDVALLRFELACRRGGEPMTSEEVKKKTF